MKYYLETKQLTKKYGSFEAVKDMSIHIKKGDIYGLIGPNGAGKTTLMKMLVGFAEPTSGLILTEDNNNFINKVGCLIESPGIYDNLNAFDNMKLKALAKGPFDRKEIEEILEFVGLSDVPKKKAGKFSLGMKQRLGIAMALIGDPELLILDEPINGLDPQGIIEIRELIKKLNTEKNMTIMISSHILSELQKVAGVFGIISKGQLVMEVSADELKNKYAGDPDSLEEFYLDVIRKGQKAC
ncbi:MAG: ATP-binding cassette domain-containing protein [Butyrivibrio sp.]|nr:ATP-binding cassette domain-containing protein [Butyrivibrio sp.]